jgi:hypothetical protein
VTLETAIAVGLAAVLFPLSFFVRRLPAQWKSAGLGTLSVFFLGYAFLYPDHRMFSIILACVAAALAAKPAGNEPA